MKTEINRVELIKAINELLHSAYDSTLEEIFLLLKKIDDEEDEEDLRDIQEAREDIRINGTVSWEEIKNEMKKDVA